MEAPSSRSRAGRRLRNNPGAAQYSKETQDMLRLMMQESRLTSFQRKRINECLNNGAALPLTFDSTPSASPRQPQVNEPVQKRLSDKPQKRTAECCRSGNSYIREQFCPGPTRDLEKEKRRLQNIMSTGQEEPTVASSQNVPVGHSREVEEERDRCQEVLDEIEERRQFLADMASLGQVKQYINLINTEISQKIRELEVLNKARTLEDAVTFGRKEQTAEMPNSIHLKEAGEDSPSLTELF